MNKTTEKEVVPFQVDVRYLPILQTGVLHANALNHVLEYQYREFTAYLLTINNGEEPKLLRSSTLLTGPVECFISKEQVYQSVQVWYEIENIIYKAKI